MLAILNQTKAAPNKKAVVRQITSYLENYPRNTSITWCALPVNS